MALILYYSLCSEILIGEGGAKGKEYSDYNILTGRSVVMEGGIYQVTGKNDFGAMTHQVLDGGNSCADSVVIGDIQVVIQRHVQIHSNEHSLSLQIGFFQIAHTPLCAHFDLIKHLRKTREK